MRRAVAASFIVMLLLLAGCQHAVRVHGDWIEDQKFPSTLRSRDKNTNGIEVNEPEIFDDSSLRVLLDEARGRLAVLNAFNEAGLINRLGAVTGGRIDQSQTGLQVTGPSIPGATITNKGATTQSENNQGAITTTSTVPAQDVTTTVPAISPPAAPTIPAGLSFTAPSSFSGSALDLLNEQLQLTFQIANLRLMLEGPISARFVRNQRVLKPRATIGFPITITPAYENAVAVVEVEVTTNNPTLADPQQGDPPIITALLPEEKTYNVAGLTDRTTSIGAGAVIGTVGVSGSRFRARRTFFVVQDQDTIALQRPRNPSPDGSQSFKNTTSFAWEFRPVLGQRFVRSGRRKTFVQLAFSRLPQLPDDNYFGTVKVRTYWRYFNQKTGVSYGVIKGSVFTREVFPVAQYDLSPQLGGEPSY